MKIEIVDSTMRHCKILSDDIRHNDRLEAENAGFDPVKSLFYSYRAGLWRKTGLIDGKVAAMWGVSGTLLGMVGQPYLITGRIVEKISPVRFAKIYTSQLKEMKRLFPVLENYVDASYEGAVRMLSLAGFRLDPVVINGNEFFKFSMVTQ